MPTSEEASFQASLRVSLSNLSSVVPSLHNSFDSGATQAWRRINHRSIHHPQADGKPLRSGASPPKWRSPSPHRPKPNRIPVPGPPAVMLPLALAGFPASRSVGHRLRGFSTQGFVVVRVRLGTLGPDPLFGLRAADSQVQPKLHLISSFWRPHVQRINRTARPNKDSRSSEKGKDQSCDRR